MENLPEVGVYNKGRVSDAEQQVTHLLIRCKSLGDSVMQLKQENANLERALKQQRKAHRDYVERLKARAKRSPSRV